MYFVEYIIIYFSKQSLLIFTYWETVVGNVTYLVIRSRFHFEDYLFLILSYLNVKFLEEYLHVG